MGRKLGAMPLLGGAGSPSNTTSPMPRPTSIPSSILIHPTVCPQYTNVIDTQTGRTGQTTVRYHRAIANRFTNGRPKTKCRTEEEKRNPGRRARQRAVYVYSSREKCQLEQRIRRCVFVWKQVTSAECLFCVGINAHEGVNVLMNAGIALAICFSILVTIVVVVNLIHNKGCNCKRK